MRPSEHGQDANSIIPTRLNMPRLSHNLIARPQLMARLDEHWPRRLSLIVAPAGYGKSTLAVRWLQTQTQPVAWLSLQGDEADLLLFARYLIAALSSASPESCKQAAALLQEASPPSGAELGHALVNGFAALPPGEAPSRPRLHLVLDDIHRLQASAAYDLLAFLLDHLPPQMHLMLIGRMDPLQLPIHRLRASHELLEMRRQDLRFSKAETRAFFEGSLQGAPDAALLEGLTARLEGWPAGLRLAALSLRDGANRASVKQALQQADRHITEYLVDEVMAALPQTQQRFLLETSILDRLSASLCAATLGVAQKAGKMPLTDLDPQSMLVALEQSNLFLIPLDGDGTWFRYHHMFQDLLQRKLHATYAAEEIERRQARAARWFAEHGYLEEAIEHALASADAELAATLIERSMAQPLNRFARITHARWLNRIPAAALAGHPGLLVAQAWLFYRQWRLAALEQLLAQMDQLLNPLPKNAPETARLAAHCATLHSAVSLFHDNKPAAAAVWSAKALRIMSGDAPDVHGAALGIGALARQQQGDLPAALAELEDGLATLTGPSPARQQIFLGMAIAQRSAGDLAGMQQTATRFMSSCGSGQAGGPPGAAWLAGMVAYEWNQLDVAAAHFAFVDAHAAATNFMAAYGSLLGKAQIALTRNEVDQAMELAARAYGDALRLDNRALLPQAAGLQAELALRRGDADGALRWARAFSPPSAAESIVWLQAPTVVWARILAAAGTNAERRAALAALAEQVGDAQARHILHREIGLLAAMALLHGACGQDEGAQSALTRAVTLGYAGGYVRTFLDCGPSLLPLLHTLNRTLAGPHHVDQLIRGFGSTPSGRLASRLLAAQQRSTPALSPLDALTRREVEVLGLIRRGLTNQEIARQLVISEATVKRHATNIFRKLEVKNRTQAVRRAERLGFNSQRYNLS